MDIQIGLLGQMTATADGRCILPSAGKPRQILALLALRARQSVPTSILLEELWGSNPPRSALATLHTYILQLRRKLSDAMPQGSEAKNVLVTTNGGYLLTVDPGQTDVGQFAQLLPRSQRALGAGDDETASRLLRQALELWRGPLMADAPRGRRLEIEAIRLEENRLGALELRIAADLRLGGHLGLLGELTALAEEYPMHEHLHAQLMLALYRSGRTGAALDAYHRLRKTLIDELGLEPTGHVQRLHEAMLRSDSDALDLVSGERSLLAS